MLSDEQIRAMVDELLLITGHHRNTAPNTAKRTEAVIRRHLEKAVDRESQRSIDRHKEAAQRNMPMRQT